MRGRGGKDIIEVRRVMEKELLTEKTGFFYLRAKGESKQTRAAGGAKEAMPGTEVQHESRGQREGKGKSRAVFLFGPPRFTLLPVLLLRRTGLSSLLGLKPGLQPAAQLLIHRGPTVIVHVLIMNLPSGGWSED